METQTLYRPVGLKEMELIVESGWKEFPPRLEWQPIFYPVLNPEYAEQIALEWNTKDAFSGYCGIVTSFEVNQDYLKHFDVQNVGGDIHNELWVLSEELDVFNTNIVGGIKIITAFFGNQFFMPQHSTLSIELLKFV
jgi:hypothetical protein